MAASPIALPTLRVAGPAAIYPPPPAGGITVAQILRILERFDLAVIGHNTPEYIRVVAEAMQEKTGGVEIKELAGFWTSPAETAAAFGKILGREVKAVPIPEDQFVEIAKNYNSPKNAASMAEMFKGFNSEYIKFETENQIAGKITIEDFAREALK